MSMTSAAPGRRFVVGVLIICFVAATVLGIAAVRWNSREVVALRFTRVLSAPGYSMLWFTPDHHLAGVRQGPEQLTFELYGDDHAEVPRREIRLPATSGAGELLWNASEDASTVAWISAGVLERRALFGTAALTPASVKLDAGSDPRGLAILGDASVAVLLSDGRLQHWDVSGTRMLRETRSPLESGILVSAGNYLGIASMQSGESIVYDVRNPARWALVETHRFSPGASYVCLSDTGHITLATGAEVRDAKHGLDAPGRVRAVGFGLGSQVLATGDFPGVFVLQPNSPPRKLADLPAGNSVLAADERGLATSGPAGTKLFRFYLDQKLTGAGKALAWSSGVLYLLAGLAPLIGWLAPRKSPRNRAGRSLSAGVKSQASFAPPPPLLEALVKNECVLYAGAGLGILSGLPGWAKFVFNLVEFAFEAGMIDSKTHRKLQEERARGNSTSSADVLVALLEAERPQLVHFYQQTFCRQALLSRAHQALIEIPFAAILTTNYDNLIEHSYGDAYLDILTPRDPRVLPWVQENRFFLLKLYGDIQRPDTISLCPREFRDVASSNSSLAKTMNHLLSTRTILFVGAGLEGLEADLGAIGVHGTQMRQHYALTSFYGRRDMTRAGALAAHYGIETLPVLEGYESNALMEFLESMQRHTRETLAKRQMHQRSILEEPRQSRT